MKDNILKWYDKWGWAIPIALAGSLVVGLLILVILSVLQGNS